MTEHILAYQGPIPGDIITCQQDLDLLPSGSHLVTLANPSHQFRRRRHRNGGSAWHDDRNGEWLTPGAEWAYLQALGEQAVVDTIQTPIAETPEQFAARFRDVILLCEQRHYGSSHICEGVLRDLGAEFDFRPSVGMRVHNGHDINLMPEGSRVYTGDPHQPNTFGLWQMRHGRWDLIFGSGANMPSEQPVIIDALPDGDQVKTEPDPWWRARLTGDQADQLVDLRRRAWLRGWKEKEDHGWCETYEGLVRMAGLDETALSPMLPSGLTYGATVNPEQAGSLPIGTYLYSIDPPGVYQRVAKSSNRAGTRRVGAVGAAHYTSQMIIGADAEGRAHQLAEAGLTPVFHYSLLDGLPPGSMITNLSGPDYFVKEEDAWLRCTQDGTARNSYRYNSEAFSSSSLNYGVSRIGAAS